MEPQKKIENSPKILYRHNAKSKWREGRLGEIDRETTRKANHKIYRFEENAKVLNWDKLKNGIPTFKFVKGWFFLYWLPEKNIKFL